MSKVKVHLGEWHLNLGIMGFMTILDFNEISYKKEANYVEFDSSILKDFSSYYFNYFMDKYSKKNSLEKSINYAIGSYTKGYISIKECNKKVKDAIMYEANKLSDKQTGFDNDAYLRLKGITDEMYALKEYTLEDLLPYINNCKDILGDDRINERLTLNVIRSVLGGTYFGQVSYLQRTASKYNLKDTVDAVYKDYIFSLDVMYTLNDLIELGVIEDIKNYIEDTLNTIKEGKYSNSRVSNIKSILNGILKILTPKKNKDLDKEDVLLSKINAYLNGLDGCTICFDSKGLVSDMSEGIFAPILLSSANALNYYWDLKVKTKVCDLCRLMYLCVDAGSVKEDDIYTFVNMQSSIEDLYNANIVFKNKVNRDSSFAELISYLIDVDEQKSKWKLQNIQIVEYFTDLDSKKSRIDYYSIPPYLARFLVSKDVVYLKGIKDYKLKLKVLKHLTSNKDVRGIIIEELREVLKNKGNVNFNRTDDITNIIILRSVLNNYKEGVNKTMNINTVKMLKMRGIDIREVYKKTGTDSRLSSLIFKLLNTVRANNKHEFIDIVIRLFNNCKMDMPSVMIEVLSSDDKEFENIAYAFISGLSSNRFTREENKEIVREG